MGIDAGQLSPLAGAAIAVWIAAATAEEGSRTKARWMAASAMGETGSGAPGISASGAGGRGGPAVNAGSIEAGLIEAGNGLVVRAPVMPTAIADSGPTAPGIAAKRLLAIRSSVASSTW